MMLVVVQRCVYTVRPVLRTAWLTCALSDTHTTSHGRGVQECLVWVIAGEHDGSRWAHPLDVAKWVAAGWREGKMATRGSGSKLSSDPTPTTAHQPPTHSLYCRQWGSRGGGSCCPEALRDFPALLFPVKGPPSTPSTPQMFKFTIKLHAMSRETIQILRALSIIPYL